MIGMQQQLNSLKQQGDHRSDGSDQRDAMNSDVADADRDDDNSNRDDRKYSSHVKEKQKDRHRNRSVDESKVQQMDVDREHDMIQQQPQPPSSQLIHSDAIAPSQPPLTIIHSQQPDCKIHTVPSIINVSLYTIPFTDAANHHRQHSDGSNSTVKHRGTKSLTMYNAADVPHIQPPSTHRQRQHRDRPHSAHSGVHTDLYTRQLRTHDEPDNLLNVQSRPSTVRLYQYYSTGAVMRNLLTDEGMGIG